MLLKSLQAALVAAGLFASGAAMAGFNTQTTDGLTQTFDPAPGVVTFTDSFVTLGTLTLDHASKVTFTFLGYEAAYSDYAFYEDAAHHWLNKTTAVGAQYSAIADAGLLKFAFVDKTGALTYNGEVFGADPVISWGLLQGATSSLGEFDYIVGLNDSAGPGLRDYDDMVIGINVTAVPEPETYAMMLAGLGAIVTTARRRARRNNG